MRRHWLNFEKSQRMCGRILALGCVFLVAMTLSGCIGLVANMTGECKNETPFTGVHDIFWTKPQTEEASPKGSTKAEFLKDWGNPDEIISTSENEETWIYNRKLWCGMIPILIILPVPLILPVCDGFDRIEFHGNEAKNLHTRHIVSSGFYGGQAGGDPACRYPLPPNNGVDSDATKPTEQVVPQPKEREDSGQRIEKPSLQPKLKWDAFIGFGEDVTYDLKIWRAKVGWRQVQQGSVVYERQGITQPSHQVEMPLEPSTHYLWAVRAHFKLNDQIQTTPWSYEIAAGAPDEPQYYHFWTPTALDRPQ